MLRIIEKSDRESGREALSSDRSADNFKLGAKKNNFMRKNSSRLLYKELSKWRKEKISQYG